jgi:cytochrome c553
MQHLILLILFVFYSPFLLSAVEIIEDEQPLIPATPQLDILSDNASKEAIDPFTRLNFPVSDAFEIRRRAWDKVSRCEICHSLEVGYSNSYIPILQGQNREYLYSKIKLFKGNPLSRHPFPNYSQSLSQDEMIDISLYYSIQNSLKDLKLVQIDSQWRDEPKELDTSIQACLDCHGRDGNGVDLIPDLSGQSRNYLSYRIREIASGSSKIHIQSDAPVSCAIGKVSIMQSRWLANKLSLVVDSTRLSRGAEVYRNHCQSCHEKGGSNAPVLSRQFDWMNHLQSGIYHYADYISRHKHKDARELKRKFLSRNQWADAVHFVLSQSGVGDQAGTE